MAALRAAFAFDFFQVEPGVSGIAQTVPPPAAEFVVQWLSQRKNKATLRRCSAPPSRWSFNARVQGAWCDASTKTRAITAGRAWTKRILRLAVAAPKRPAMITHTRKKIRVAVPAAPCIIPHTNPAARKPL